MKEAGSPDHDRFITLGRELRDAIVDSLHDWMETVVRARLGQSGELSPDRLDQLAAIGTEVAAELGQRLEQLAIADVDEPVSGPLEIVRQSTGPLTRLLTSWDVPRPVRDEFDAAVRPDDVFALGPMSFAELGQRVQEAGIAWGAAKAYLHRRRHGDGSSTESG